MGEYIGIDLGAGYLRGASLRNGELKMLHNSRTDPEEPLEARLKRVREDAERQLGTAVTGASVAVPLWYDDEQRRALKEAGRRAGLDESGHLRILNAVSAVALADHSRLGGYFEEEKWLLVCRLGEGLEAAVVNAGQDVVELVACGSDSSLSAAAYHRRLANTLVGIFRQNTGVNLSLDTAVMERLQDAARKAVGDLASVSAVQISLPELAGGNGLDMTLTREQFGAITSDLTARIRKTVEKVLAQAEKYAKLCGTACTIYRVLLAEDAAGMEEVRKAVCAAAGCSDIQDINSTQCVALGAAVQAGIRCGRSDALLLDGPGYALALDTEISLLDFDSVVPSNRIVEFTVSEAGQTTGQIAVRKRTADYAAAPVWKKYLISGIPASEKRDADIVVKFDVNYDGIWSITARDAAHDKPLTVKAAGEDETALPLIPKLYAEAPKEKKPKEPADPEASPEEKQALVLKMLPVYDSLDRALSQPTADAAYRRGVELTMKQLEEIFTGMGVECFGKAGETFDPHIHNAVVHIYDGNLGENVISQVLEKGFRLNGKIVRFAMVQVAN